MKKTISVALFVALLFTASIPSFAQKSLSDRGRGVKTGTQFGNVGAFTDGRGVLVRWEMETEVGNVGFNVYRTGAGVKERVNPTIIASWGRAGSRTLYGETYEVFDPDGDAGSGYLIESLAIDGRRFSSKPVQPIIVKDLKEATGTSAETFITAALSKNHNVEGNTSSLTTELSQIVGEAQQTPNLVRHRWVVSQPGAKIAVKKDGMYRIPSVSLEAGGFAIGGDSTKWRLFLEGNEQSIIVGDANQYIEFYGKGIDRPESDTRFYYLIADTVAGKRMTTKVMRPIAGFAVSNNYPVTAQKKERLKDGFSQTFFNGDEENYLGRLIDSEGRFPVPFTLTGVDFASQNAQITVKARGFSNNGHIVRLIVNGNEIPQMTGFGANAFSTTATIPTSYLLEGSNSLQMISSSPSDYSYFDSVTVRYSRKYQADQNRTSFFTPGYRKVDVTGFTSTNIRIFDTTYDGSPSLITNLPVVQDGGTYTVKIPSGRTMVSYGVEDSALLQSPSVTANTPSTLAVTSNGADLIIISYGAADFMAAAETWANYRRGQGFTVRVVDIADVFDEFNYGVSSSDALKSFLNYAYSNWQLRPRYVLLLGDGSHDPRNYEGSGYFDLVPTMTVRLIWEESGSDEALADFDDDGLAEMAIGRISARTAAEITTAFNKTTTFETPAMQSLSRGALFAHDVPRDYDFAGMSQIMANELPRSMPVAMVGRGLGLPPPNQYQVDPTAQTNLINGMNAGKYIVNYSGHGSTGVWASSDFFGSSSVPQLTNIDRPSIFVMLTCLNGYFLRPNADSLSEFLLKSSSGGSAAAWSSTSLTTPDVQLIMATQFFNQLAAGNITRIGDLIKDAKIAIPGGADVRLSWVLLGDPMLKVR